MVIHSYSKELDYAREVLKYVCINDKHIIGLISNTHYITHEEYDKFGLWLFYYFDNGYVGITHIECNHSTNDYEWNNKAGNPFILGKFDTDPDFKFKILEKFVDPNYLKGGLAQLYHSIPLNCDECPIEDDNTANDAALFKMRTNEFLYEYGMWGIAHFFNKFTNSINLVLKAEGDKL